jgi:hypothetical protein
MTDSLRYSFSIAVLVILRFGQNKIYHPIKKLSNNEGLRGNRRMGIEIEISVQLWMFKLTADR